MHCSQSVSPILHMANTDEKRLCICQITLVLVILPSQKQLLAQDSNVLLEHYNAITKAIQNIFL